MSNAAPPEWLLGLPGLDAGAKLALLGLRSYGPFDPEAAAVFVFPSRAAVARRIGQKENTLKGQLKRLTKLKIITAETREVDGELRKGWSIADRALCEMICRGHEVPEPGSHSTHGSHSTRVSEDPTVGHTVPEPGSHSTQAGVSGDPFNLQGCSDLVENVEDARPPSESDTDENTTTPHPPAAPAPRPMARTPGDRGPTAAREADGLAVAHPEHVHRRQARAQRRGPQAGSKLSPKICRRIEQHDRGWWSSRVMDQTWCDSVAEAMDCEVFDLGVLLAVLDVHREQTRDGVPDGTPNKRAMFFGRGDQGRVARVWLRRTLSSVRAPKRATAPLLSLADAQAEAYR